MKYLLATVLLLIGCIYGGLAQPWPSRHIAQGDSLILTAHANNARSYLWFRDGEPLNGYHNERLIVREAGMYTVLALGDACNSDMSDPVIIIVDDNGDQGSPIVDMQIYNEPDRPTVMIGGTFFYQLFIVNKGDSTATEVTVTATLSENVSFESILGTYAGQAFYSPSSRELTWRPGDIASQRSETLTFGVRANREGLAVQLAVVSSKQTDINLNNNRATAAVDVVALSIPNVFTPNGDGINDLFEVRGLEYFPENRLTIFNRWGSEIYKATPYRNNWDGANLAEGTYYYIFDIRLHNGPWETFKGFVTIIRNPSH